MQEFYDLKNRVLWGKMILKGFLWTPGLHLWPCTACLRQTASPSSFLRRQLPAPGCEPRSAPTFPAWGAAGVHVSCVVVWFRLGFVLWGLGGKAARVQPKEGCCHPKEWSRECKAPEVVPVHGWVRMVPDSNALFRPSWKSTASYHFLSCRDQQ